MILIDSNIPMYLIGAPHPHKDAALRLLEAAIGDYERLVTDAEVFQEILHRYHAIRRPDAIQPAFNALHGVADEVFPVELTDVEQAKGSMLGTPGLSARVAVHAAVMKRHGVARLMSFDAGFDRLPWIERIPAR
jgi:predicted nucleic acid-binding protein